MNKSDVAVGEQAVAGYRLTRITTSAFLDAVFDGCGPQNLVGTGSIVLHRAIVRSGALVGAGAVVPNGMDVPSGAMALGVPARIREGAVTPDQITRPAQEYVRNWTRYRAELRRIE